MKKKITLFLTLIIAIINPAIYAQVTIGSGIEPDKDALLDLKEENVTTKGLLMPRVALSSTTAYTPLSRHVVGMTVYNIATVGDVTPGYYYNDGTKWVRMATATAGSNSWNLTGNLGTIPGTNFLGTTDDNALVFKVNNTFAGYIGTITATSPVTQGNVALGYNALPYALTTTKTIRFDKNIAIGLNAMAKSTTPSGAITQNVSVGDNTLTALESGGTNVAIGTQSLGGATHADSNIAIGTAALFTLSDATDQWGNIALGYLAARYLTKGRSNIYMGNYTAGARFNSGNNNVLIGGHNPGQGLITGNNNIAIGNNSALNNTSNQLNIGNVIYGTGLSTSAFRIGVGNSNSILPSETFDTNGTVRVRSLPANGMSNSIYTQADGTPSDARDQPFIATRTVVADVNGVLGTVTGLPATGTWNTIAYPANATNNTVTINLSSETTLKDLYIVNDNTTGNNGYSIIISLPANIITTATTRIIRFIVIPVEQNYAGLRFNGNIGNLAISGAGNNGISIVNGSNGYVSISRSNNSRFESLITFTEIDGKWYVDRSIIKN